MSNNNNHVNFGVNITYTNAKGERVDEFEPWPSPARPVHKGILELIEFIKATGRAKPMTIEGTGDTGYHDNIKLSQLPEGADFGIGVDSYGRPFVACRVENQYEDVDENGNDVLTISKPKVWVLHQRYRNRGDIWVGAGAGPGAWPFDGYDDMLGDLKRIANAITTGEWTRMTKWAEEFRFPKAETSKD